MTARSDEQFDLNTASPLASGRKRLDDVEMDITPMIDITFLLLIFFLVCSAPDQGTAVELAKARHGKGIPQRDSLILTVSAEQSDPAPVYLADGMLGDPLPEDADTQRDVIVEAVEKSRREQGNDNVIIKADRNVAHRDVSRVIKAVSRVQGAKIFLGVLDSD